MSASTTAAAPHQELTEQEMLDRIDLIIDQMGEMEGKLIPVLQNAQNMFGYLPQPVLKRISLKLGIPFSEVAGVVSFYSYFSTIPRGRHVVRVCLGTACYVRGGKDVLEALQKQLGIKVGETTADRLFSLEVGRCFGACGLAPVVMVDDDVHQRVKPSRIKELLLQYATGSDKGEDA